MDESAQCFCAAEMEREINMKGNTNCIDAMEPSANIILAQRFDAFLGGAPMPGCIETRKWLFWLWLEDMNDQNGQKIDNIGRKYR